MAIRPGSSMRPYPSPPALRRPRIVLVLSVAFVCLGLWLGCTADPSDELLAIAPTLPPELARALATKDVTEVRRALRDAGHVAYARALWQAYESHRDDDVEEFREHEAKLAPFIEVLQAATAAEYPGSEAVLQHAALRKHPIHERLEVVRLMSDIRAMVRDENSPVETREQVVRDLLERARPYADTLDLGDLYGTYANLLPRLNRQADMPYYLRAGIQASLAGGFVTSACQLLGTLGVVYESAGDESAMRECWDQALELARNANNWQEARILSFYAAHYRSRGQFAVARDLVLQAQDRAGELRAREVELRFLYESLRLFGSLGCWEVVGNSLQRAEVLQRRGRDMWAPLESETWTARLQQIRARYLAAVESCAPAESLAHDLVRRTERWQPTPPRQEIRLNAARVLLSCGRAREAQHVLERGTDECLSHSMPELLEEYSLEAAHAYFALGDVEQCRHALDAFRAHATAAPSEEVVRNWIRHDALDVRVALRTAGRAAAVERLGIALERLAQQQRQMGASPESYLALAIADELRELAHLLSDGSAESGYALEMAWRRFRARQPRDSAPAPTAGLLSLAAFPPQAPFSGLAYQLRTRNVVHCVYDVRDSGIVRWTASERGVTRDTVAMPRSRLQALVDLLATRLADRAAPRDSIDADTAQQLHLLAKALLPAEVWSASPSTRLLVSPEGLLCRLPFEALNLSNTRYEPLLSQRDVAYLRLWRESSNRDEGEAIVVSRPAYPAGLRRRYSILNEELKLGTAEAELFRALLPRSIPLVGDSATKGALLERWEQARFLYFACHVVQDPEVPYIAFVPMAAASSGRDADAYLELADILGADLSRCELVVLSSCASGAPYVARHVASPSLGDAFIDAGAHAVVSTFWSVRDDAAARVMREFAREYGGRGSDAVAALSAARRRMMREGAGPHEWAAYAITLGGF